MESGENDHGCDHALECSEREKDVHDGMLTMEQKKPDDVGQQSERPDHDY